MTRRRKLKHLVAVRTIDGRSRGQQRIKNLDGLAARLGKSKTKLFRHLWSLEMEGRDHICLQQTWQLNQLMKMSIITPCTNSSEHADHFYIDSSMTTHLQSISSTASANSGITAISAKPWQYITIRISDRDTQIKKLVLSKCFPFQR